MATDAPQQAITPRTSERATIRVAACADVHCRPDRPNPTVDAIARLDETADMLLLAGDLTTCGEPDEARVLADACSGLEIPAFAVLGNHDWHAGRADEVTAELERGGVNVLDRSWAIERINGIEVGIVGTKGFVGGFPGSHLPDFGEPSLRNLYRETGEQVAGLDAGLHEIAVCALRIVVMHYSPTTETLEGERPGIWAFLGTDRLAAPLIEHGPDLVVHGHAHAGRFAGKVGEVDVFNVSVPVIGRDYWLFELEPEGAMGTSIR
jgi:Icc-related predicted phosphoesterase